MITDQARIGNITRDQATELRHVLARIEDVTSSHAASAWHPGQFHKRFPNDDLAPALARAALATTAIGIPADDFENAALLISELVTNSVKHGDSEWVEVAITLGSEVLRIEVSDHDKRSIRPRAPDVSGGWGLALVAELATRWGVERQRAGKTIWVDFDLPSST
jgi:anti-sigma regulatory factor (Ser/Thr protein kinase)